MTFENYLREAAEKGVIDFSVRAYPRIDGRIAFYIHPARVSGRTIDFEVIENDLVLIHVTNAV